jgi:polyisoprenoid-binding protein YceI
MKTQLLVLFTSAVAFSQPATYQIQPTPASSLSLQVFKTGFMSGKKHLFVFERYSGKLVYEAAAPENSRVELVIESSSIVLKDQWLSPEDMKKVREHAGKEMLDIARYPRILFSSTKVTRSAAGSFTVAGNLTIRDIAKPVLVSVALQPETTGALKLTGKAEVKLRDYGLKPPSAALGTVGTKNEMAFDFIVFAKP